VPVDQPDRNRPKSQERKGGESNDSPIEHIPVDNCPSLQWSQGAWTVEGYSRAAVQTYWRIPELRVGFDLGNQPWDHMGTPTYFVSHTHMDHIAALPAYVARRRMMKMDPPTIYAPAASLSAIDQLLKAFTRLDRGRLPVQLIGVEPGMEIELSRELLVTTVAMRHSIPCIGFVLWERRKKLKAEYQGLSGDQIRDIRLSGVEVSAEMRHPLLAYAGDTTAQGLDDNPVMYDADVLITEMTFLAPSHRKELIHKHGHTHLDDLVQRRSYFRNRTVICGHFSTRYTLTQIRRLVHRALPDMLDGRLKLWLD